MKSSLVLEAVIGLTLAGAPMALGAQDANKPNAGQQAAVQDDKLEDLFNDRQLEFFKKNNPEYGIVPGFKAKNGITLITYKTCPANLIRDLETEIAYLAKYPEIKKSVRYIALFDLNKWTKSQGNKVANTGDDGRINLSIKVAGFANFVHESGHAYHFTHKEIRGDLEKLWQEKAGITYGENVMTTTYKGKTCFQIGCVSNYATESWKEDIAETWEWFVKKPKELDALCKKDKRFEYKRLLIRKYFLNEDVKIDGLPAESIPSNPVPASSTNKTGFLDGLRDLRHYHQDMPYAALNEMHGRNSGRSVLYNWGQRPFNHLIPNILPTRATNCSLPKSLTASVALQQ